MVQPGPPGNANHLRALSLQSTAGLLHGPTNCSTFSLQSPKLGGASPCFSVTPHPVFSSFQQPGSSLALHHVCCSPLLPPACPMCAPYTHPNGAFKCESDHIPLWTKKVKSQASWETCDLSVAIPTPPPPACSRAGPPAAAWQQAPSHLQASGSPFCLTAPSSPRPLLSSPPPLFHVSAPVLPDRGGAACQSCPKQPSGPVPFPSSDSLSSELSPPGIIHLLTASLHWKECFRTDPLSAYSMSPYLGQTSHMAVIPHMVVETISE